jgi:adenine C2-methylase RlmN of 23S rRNA A2503 and tRNA A37
MRCTYESLHQVRNLKAGEIIGQLMTAKRALFDFPTAQDKVVSNIVFMGQGEPVST